MQVYVHSIIVSVVTLDPNPASVAVTVDTLINDHQPKHPKARILATNSNAADGSSSREVIPDEPFDGQPDNDTEMQQHDDWVNTHVYTLL